MEVILFEIYTDVERAIDLAFDGHFVLKFYDYLKISQPKGLIVQEFLESKSAKNLKVVIQDLECYLEGGSDKIHQQLREGYGHIPKPQARKIKNYLQNILTDAQTYINEKQTRKRKSKPK